jgi:hypothetical protein
VTHTHTHHQRKGPRDPWPQEPGLVITYCLTAQERERGACGQLRRLPVYYLKRPVDFGSGLCSNENDSDEKLYGSLDQRDERSVMA